MTVVIALMLAGAPNAPATGDPCSLTDEPTGLGNRVCYERNTITTADGLVTNVEAGQHGTVTFVTFDVHQAGSFAVVSRDDTTWSRHLPADDRLGLRVPTAVPLPVDEAAESNPYRLVHLATPMIPEWQAAFESAGITTHVYLPVNNFIVRMPDAEDAMLFDLAFVEEVTMYPVLAKLEPALMQEPEAVRKVNILTMPGADGAFEATLDHLATLDAVVTQEAPEIERIQAWVPVKQLVDVVAFPHVLWVDQAGEGPAEHDMDIIRGFIGTDYISGLPGQYDGSSVVGQVMDVGFDADHQDFRASLLGLDGPISLHYHGTAVYGIVFGDGTGRDDATGQMPAAHGTYAQAGQGTRYQRAANIANDHGGVFQTHSWGNSIPKDNTYDSYSNENDRVVADLDVLMLQSMSNCGPQCARREAMAKNIISVGALYHFNNAILEDDKWNRGASTGPAADGRIKPELAAAYDSILTTTVDGYMTGFGGTSGATPIVAGTVGLTHDMWNKGVFGEQTEKLKPATAKALLIASANAFNPDQVQINGDTTPTHQWFLEPVKRDIQGWGLPDLRAMHDAAPNTVVRNEQDAVATGDTVSFTYTPPVGATRIHVSLVWTDVPANPGANPTLVNNLDLTVNNGLLPYFGNFGLDQGETNLPLGVPDALNNNEQVFIPAVPGQDLTITVLGTSVQMDADPATPGVQQPFSLAVMSF